MKQNDGGPAFPSREHHGIEGARHVYVEGGMTLRDWFAGQALAGLTSNTDVRVADDVMAAGAYGFADAMLAEREKDNE